jgi:hypothetical protein
VLASGLVVLVSISTSLDYSLRVGAVAYALLAVVGPRLTSPLESLRHNVDLA